MDDKVLEFLIEAKKNTYAGKKGEVASSRLNSHDLKYEKDNLMYYDTYLGGDLFSGEEALWINNEPCWSMNYIGRVKENNFSGDFLKEALLLVNKEYPYRGPLYYKNGDYEYIMEVKGDFNWFYGHEIIKYKNVEIYECNFHGGLVKQKR
ncbi:MAG: hypothetical protein J6Y28_00655 [Acholeplasmatales bacterium]|nr:hypothetical protein [Acholeplasmatales bacterium]